MKKSSSRPSRPTDLQGSLFFPADRPNDPGITAGVDEAGRGCLAGPVVAGAVILPASFDLPGLTDSKACTAKQRDTLAPRIRACAISWGLGIV